MRDDLIKFLQRGNMVDMAVGIAVGSAFTAIVKSLVADVVMPPLGLLLGGVDFSDMFVLLRDGDPTGPYASLAAAKEAGAQTWRFGLFLNSVVTFLIVAVAFFFVIQGMERMRRLTGKKEPAPAPASGPTTKVCPFCRTEIDIEATRCPACTSELGGSA